MKLGRQIELEERSFVDVSAVLRKRNPAAKRVWLVVGHVDAGNDSRDASIQRRTLHLERIISSQEAASSFAGKIGSETPQRTGRRTEARSGRCNRKQRTDVCGRR